MVLAALALSALGLVFIDSASYLVILDRQAEYARQQGLWLAVAVLAFAVCAIAPSTFWARWAASAYFLALVLLGLVLLLGQAKGGAQRWLSLGVIDVVPSEPAKLALIVFLAQRLMHRGPPRRPRELLGALWWVLPPLALIVLQPDLGTALVLPIIAVAMVFVAGARKAHLVLLATLALCVAPLFWRHGMQPYQQGRFLAFLNPEAPEHYLNQGYQLIQSRIAVGSGGLWGRGLGEGTQTQGGFLPERHTDMIFSVIGEEAGFLGCALVLLLYAVLLGALAQRAGRTRDRFGRLVLTGVAALLGFQVLVNSAMTVGLMPITGLTLPLVSYGGTSLVTCAAALGLAVSVTRSPAPAFAGEEFEPCPQP